MRRISNLLPVAIIGCALLVTHPARAQAPAGDALAQLTKDITSEDRAVRAKAFDGLRAMGRQGVDGLLAMLVEPGKGDDAGARYALHGMAARARVHSPGEDWSPFLAALSDYLRGEAPPPLKRFVIAQLQIAGGEESVPALAACLGDPDLAESACEALVANPSPAAMAALRDALPKAGATARVSIVQAVGERRDARAVDALLAEAKSGDVAVRLAAIEALGRIGDPRAEPVIAGALGKGTEAEQRAVFDAYLRLAEAMRDGGRAAQARNIYVHALQAASNPSRRCAALVGIAAVGTAADVSAVLPFVSDPDPLVRHSAAQCLAGMADEKVAPALAEAMKGSPPPVRAAVLRVLALRKDVGPIEAARQDPDAEVRVTAAELLGRLDDPGLEGTLLEAAEKGSDAIHPIALAAYMHLAEGRAGKGERDAALAMYTRALDLARTDALRGAALRGLATVPSVDSLPKVEAQLENDALRDDALVAYVAIARTIAQAGDKARAVAMLQQALQTARARDVVQASVAGLRDLGVDVDPARESGFVTTWWIIGPFPGSDIDKAWPPEEGVDLAAALKADDRELRWAKHHTTDLTGIVNLAGMMRPNEDATAYLYAEVTPDEARDVIVKIGSDDGVKCWLNGQLIDRFPEPRSLTVDQDKVETRLTAGVNRLLLKVVQGGGGWECCLRITDRDGKAVKCAQKEE